MLESNRQTHANKINSFISSVAMTATQLDGGRLLSIRVLAGGLCVLVLLLILAVAEVVHTRFRVAELEQRLQSLELAVAEKLFYEGSSTRVRREVPPATLKLYHTLREVKHQPANTTKSPYKHYEASSLPPVLSRPSRVMKTDPYPSYMEFRASPTAFIPIGPKTQRAHMKAESRSSASVETFDEHPVSSRPRKPGRRIVAVHYDGDTSGYSSGDEHYTGNGRLRHPDGIFVDWTPSNWSHSVGSSKHFSLSNGKVTVRRTGLYYVYAQIYYVDEHDANGYRMYVNDKPVLHCTTHSTSTDRIAIANTCHSSTLAFLNENDQISLRDVEGLRYSLFEPAKSFFGMMKITEGVWR